MKANSIATKNQRGMAIMLSSLIFFQSTGQGLQLLLTDVDLKIPRIGWQNSSREIGSTSKLDDKLLLSDIEISGTNKVPETPSSAGPDQPEVQSFTPIGTSDMVDPFTGDFSYNIPLLDVDGYPINLGYNAGVTMDQEASWVGLGWNVNPGVMNRALRGLPDDFNGTDIIEKEMSQRPNTTTSLNRGIETEIIGVNVALGLSLNLGMSYNNYNGASASFGFGFNYDIPKTPLNIGLGFNGDSQSGASLDPNLSFQKVECNDEKIEKTSKKLSIGSPFNSRSGLQSVSMNYSRTTEKYKGAACNAKTGATEYIMKSGSQSLIPLGSSFNLGNSTFSPKVSMPMNSFGFTFSYKFGVDLTGVDPTFPIKGTFHSSFLYKKQLSSRAYGYNHLGKAIHDERAVLDFSRENDGAVTKNTPALSNTALTYDIYSPSGQGVGGSYRSIRNDVGYVFDPKMSSYNENGSVGLESSVGSVSKLGFDVGLTYSDNRSSVWDERGNQAIQDVKFSNDKVSYREANELSVDPNYGNFTTMGGEQPVRFKLNSITALKPALEDNSDNQFSIPNTSNNSKRIRNQVMYPLTIQEMIQNIGVSSLPSNSYAYTHPEVHDHNGQYTVLNVEGSRYVYGLPAYSHFQKSVSFSVSGNAVDYINGTVSYDHEDNSTNNHKGTDHFFSSEKTPAFAHSYLLTSVLNADYIDADNIKGPSKNDLGGYVLFDYKQISLFKWRIPYSKDAASFDEGLNTDSGDDKGHYTAGEKELWYLNHIKSKNHIALFYTSDRLDGNQMLENGHLDVAGEKMQKLDSIALFSLPDYEKNGANATPIKVVHFEYDYSLCKNYPLNGNATADNGKLTLKKVYFTYQHSNKGRLAAYKFQYSAINPDYNAKSCDKWGVYKKHPDNFSGQIHQDPLRPSDFPYVGFDQEEQDENASAWNLNQILLPFGGKIEVDYESDDYAYVQNKRAAQMFKIVGVEFNNNGTIAPQFGNQTISLSNGDIKNAKVYFELMPKPEGGYYTDIKEYIPEYQPIYFRALMKFVNGYDFVPGFAPANPENMSIEVINGIPYGAIRFDGAKLKDNGNADYNPIAVAGIQFGRLHLSKFIPPSNYPNTSIGNDDQPNILDGLIGMFASYGEFFTGPNKALWDHEVGTDLVLNHSWLRLQNPNKKRLGGGHRVKEIRIHDAWNELTNNQMDGFYYGQSYSYTDKEGNSSGVAAYEPMLGGDENIFRKPVSFNNNLILAPDESNYQIEPYGEQFFPTASVGYSIVTISNLKRTNVTRTATGKVVHEFYTAKDFPTIVGRTQMDYKRYKMPSVTFFWSYMNDALSASQGFVVQTNDMHGKPKSQAVYAEGKTEVLSSVKYVYKTKTESYEGKLINKLDNAITSINTNGTITVNQLGLNYEAVADFRKSTSQTISGSIGNNVNVLPFVPVITIPAFIPSLSYERTAYRGATFTKVIERFGILETTIATDLSSVVQTKNLAYDASTGAVLLTETQTNFNDAVYNLTFPAHWYYNNMGQAYRNIDFEIDEVTFSNGTSSKINATNAVPGDEVYLYSTSNTYLPVWVVEANAGGIKIVDKFGNPINGTFLKYKVIRSGRKNVQTTPIGTITLRENPLNNINSNIYKNVLQASAVEFSDDWRTFCDCFITEGENGNFNPYIIGVKGNWRPVTSYVHLSGRNQHYVNKNTNIRNDGFMTSFSPFYQVENGKWKIKKDNWTYTSSVTEFSPFGQALETKDALNRFTSSQFGYNQTFATAVAANTRYKQLGYDGFEDYDFDNCSDDHFRLASSPSALTSNHSHTGSYGILVGANSSVTLTKPLSNGCDLQPCALEVVVVENDDIREYTISGGNLPLSIEQSVINGNPITTLNETGNKIQVSSNSNFETDLFITDSKGCTQTIHAKKFK